MKTQKELDEKFWELSELSQKYQSEQDAILKEYPASWFKMPEWDELMSKRKAMGYMMDAILWVDGLKKDLTV